MTSVKVDADKAINESIDGKYFPIYLPDGFILTSLVTANEAISLDFFNKGNNKSITLVQQPNYSHLYQDSEDSTITTKKEINGHIAFITQKDDLIHIIWEENDIVINLYSFDIDLEATLQIAENIKYYSKEG